MVITALSQMSRLSNAFRYVDYEVDIARQDTVNLTTILLNNNQIQLQRPALYISAPSRSHQNVTSKPLWTPACRARVDLATASRNATIIGMEMHLRTSHAHPDPLAGLGQRSHRG